MPRQNNHLKVLTVRLSPDQVKEIDDLVKECPIATNKTSLIREALDIGLKEVKKKILAMNKAISGV
jgi:Arc/MetJ-type ribon-helix-helix transcriptional regulator